MGVMLSILVACVGVIELLTLYQNISRHLRYPPQRGDLFVISERYIKELGNIPRRPNENFTWYTKEHPPALRLNSHEDIEIEYSEELRKSRSASPRKFLVTETEDSVNVKSRSCSPRKFLVSEEVGIKKNKSIPEFVIQEDRESEKSLFKTRYILKEKQSEESPIPLPRQFIVSEEALNTVVFDDVDFEVPQTSEIAEEHEASPFLIVDTPTVPRNSICSEFITGVDKEPLKSFDTISGEKINVILESTNFNTTQYWTNKVLVAPSIRDRSKSASPDREPNGVQLDEKYLNALDGVTKAKHIKRFKESRRSIKKKNSEQHSKDLSKDITNDDTTKILKHAAQELEKVSQGLNEPSTSKSIIQTKREPFWVND